MDSSGKPVSTSERIITEENSEGFRTDTYQLMDKDGKIEKTHTKTIKPLGRGWYAQTVEV